MKRILVSMPDELHELMRELALRKRTSVSKLVLAAVEDTYEDEIDVIAGERGLQEYLADPSSSISWEELKARLAGLKEKRGVRAITLTREQIDAALPRVAKGLRQYLYLQAYVANHDAFDDRKFRRRYNGFYRVRQRAPDWYDAFYRLMARAKRERLEFPAILRLLWQDTNRCEAAFASKLAATIDPSAPVIDSIVLRNLGLRLPYRAAINREAEICTLHQKLASLFKQFLRSANGKYLISRFKRMYPAANITEVKMLDLVLWQSRAP